MNAWVAELKQYLPAETPILIAGNKADQKVKAINEEVAKQYAKSVHSKYFKTSAKTGEGVREIFAELAKCNHKAALITYFIIEIIYNKQHESEIKANHPAKGNGSGNNRGALKVGGYDQFNPDVNLLKKKKKKSSWC